MSSRPSWLPDSRRLDLADRRAIKREWDDARALEACEKHPAPLMARMTMPDTRDVSGFGLGADEEIVGEFKFAVDDPESGWYWQREVLEWWLEHPRTMILKARQLGITWLACGFALWLMIFRPGSNVGVWRQKEKDAVKIVDRAWSMYLSLPMRFRGGATVLHPDRGKRPSSSGITLEFPNGRISRMLPMTSSESEGHGDVFALAIGDEFAYNKEAASAIKAITAAIGQRGKLILISTANGVSNPETGEGNYFHFLWSQASRIQKKFLGWFMHPDRDEEWYWGSPETADLRWWERESQYPNNPAEAFATPDKVYFDRDALRHYGQHASEALYRFDFEREQPRRARRVASPEGRITVYAEPAPDVDYAIGADVATGRGTDRSAAYVIDLTTMELCAEFHGRIDPDQFAYQLHYLGRWYNTARIAVERGGGYGEPVIVNLRDGRDGRPPYPRQFRYREQSRADTPQREQYGFPMTAATRPKVINALERVIRDRLLPAMPPGLLLECNTFVLRETNPSPRALDGTNDDRVMAACVTLELYRLYGYHADAPRRKPHRKRLYEPLGDKPGRSDRSEGVDVESAGRRMTVDRALATQTVEVE